MDPEAPMTEPAAGSPMAAEGFPELVLHANWRSSSSQRVAIGLRLKQLPFRYVAVDLDAREQEGEAFRALHPGAQVPVLVADGVAMGQSLAILEWLEECWPDRGMPLLGGDPQTRWRARQIAQLIASLLQPFQLPGATRRRLLQHLAAELEPPEAMSRCRAFSREHLERGLATVEQLLAAAGDGPFAVGAAPGLADCCIVPQLISAAGLGVDVNRYARLSRLYERCQELDAFRASHPALQPDAPEAAGVAPAGAAAPVGMTAAAEPNALPGKEQATGARTQPAAPPAAAGGMTAAAAGPAELLRAKEPAAATGAFLLERANAPIPELAWVRQETARLFGPLATKMTPLDVCLLLRWLVGQLQARLVVEVGVFSGSSALALASGLGPQDRLIAFDPATDTTAIARQAWQRAGLAERISLRHEDAALGVPALAGEVGVAGRVDLAYVDGCNSQYRRNYEDLLPLLRPGGVIVFDNTLWKGGVADPGCTDPQALHLRELIEALRHDPRVESCSLSLGDGLTLARKREATDGPTAAGSPP